MAFRSKGRGNDAEARAANNRAKVLAAVETLCASKRVATRQEIVSLTGLHSAMVDDHLKRLKQQELVQSPSPALYVVPDRRESRPVSGTPVPGGFKLEVGDVVLDLTMMELRDVAMVTHGGMVVVR